MGLFLKSISGPYLPLDPRQQMTIKRPFAAEFARFAFDICHLKFARERVRELWLGNILARVRIFKSGHNFAILPLRVRLLAFP